MPDYQLGKIYTIRCRADDTLIYVGSTTQPLYKRFHSHKRDSEEERCKNMLLYQKINGDWDNWYIELYENCPCNTREELLKREGEVIRKIGNINIRIAGRNKQEYMKEYYENNKAKKNEYQKEYNENNKARIAEYKEKNKTRLAECKNKYMKEYYEKNKARIAENNKARYERLKAEQSLPAVITASNECHPQTTIL